MSSKRRMDPDGCPDARVARAARPLLFLDFDDVICTGQPYGGQHVFSSDKPADLWARLWHPPAVQALLEVMQEHRPRVILTTAWLRRMEREGFEALFALTGLAHVGNSLHDAWEAPQDRNATRLQAIERWLEARHQGEPFVVLDDTDSGTGLSGSRLDRAGRVVLCKAGVGLHAGHLPLVRKALVGRP
jgi:hypothetical protein